MRPEPFITIFGKALARWKPALCFPIVLRNALLRFFLALVPLRELAFQRSSAAADGAATRMREGGKRYYSPAHRGLSLQGERRDRIRSGRFGRETVAGGGNHNILFAVLALIGAGNGGGCRI